MKTSLKTLAALALLSAASMTAHAQAYKPDWATKLILPKNGTTPGATNITITAGNTSSGYTLTLPTAGPGANQILTAAVGGQLSWADLSSSVTLNGDVTGAANANTVVKINGVSLGANTAAPSDGYMLLYNADNSAWEAHGMTGDVTISNTGATSIGTDKVTSAMILDGTIANVDVAANAAIAGTKISPDFGSQAVTTSGNISTTGSGTITSAGLLTASNGLTAGGTVTLSGLNAAGVVHTNGSGVLSTSAIVNADVDANAAIAGTKISPDFGSQAVTTSGNFSTTGSGTVTSAGLLTASAGLTVTGTSTLAAVKMTPTTVSTANATENNFAIGTANSYFYLASTATSGTVLSSLTGGVDGRVIIIVNNGAKNITLLSDDGSTGTAANRFKLAGGENVILAPDGIATLVYEGNSTNRWRLVSAQ